MPGLSGFELLDRLGEDPNTAAIPVIIRTSIPLGEIDAGSLARAAAVFSKLESIQLVVDRIAASIDPQSRNSLSRA